MRDGRLLNLLGGLALMLAGACDTAAAGPAVTIDNFAFTPARITVAHGASLTWINHDDIPHTVVDADNPRRMRSPPMDSGESFSFTFNKPGTYHYFCSLHPHMQGTVVVQ